VLRQLRYQIQPYELEPGGTEGVLTDAVEYLRDVLKEKQEFELSAGWKKLVAGRKIDKKVTMIGKFLNLLKSKYFTTALTEVRGKFNDVPVDRFRVRPIVKVIGEFSAALADGDMNFKMYDFLEKEGAEVLLDPAVSSQLLLTLYQHKRKLQDRKGVYENGDAPPAWRLDQRLRDQLQHMKKVGVLTLAEKLFNRECSLYQTALGGTVHEITDVYELERLAQMFYNWRCSSGESHLEIGKNIYNHTHDLCHMVLSLKPFGCLPSTQSDGAQVAVVEKYKDMIFLSIETSGEGEILAHSRVQMALDTARDRAEQEFERVLGDIGKNLDQLREYVEQHPELKRPIYPVPPRKGIVGRAALFALHVNDLMEGRDKVAKVSP
jgi:predicted nucleotide-binding protein (sugar kinase/HSP70/actin superfamily)